MASPALTGPGSTFKGSHLSRGRCVFRYQAAGQPVRLGCFKPEAAKTGARLYDAVQLLLHGPYADTNFEWSGYTLADVASAASVLEAKGVDVHKTVAAAVEARGAGGWNGACYASASLVSWKVRVGCQINGSSSYSDVHWGSPHPTAEAAAHQADCAYLATRGLGCTPNFPASTYSQQQLQEAGGYAISKGVDATRVHASQLPSIHLQPAAAAGGRGLRHQQGSGCNTRSG
jgi:hypothetical protein